MFLNSLCVVLVLHSMTVLCQNSTFCDLANGSRNVLNVPENITDVWIDLDNIVKSCDGRTECLDETTSSETRSHNVSLRQISPVITRKDAIIRFKDTNHLHNLTMVDIYIANEKAFSSCGDIGDVHVNVEISSELPREIMATGYNYILVDVYNNISESCTSGYRVNITLLEPMCRADTDTDTDSQMCDGHGHCMASTDQFIYRCECCPGFEGEFCQQTKAVKDSPTMQTQCSLCQNGGTCVMEETNGNGTDSNSSALTCQCGSMFGGDRCEYRLDHCQSNPCQHGVCVEKLQAYQCFCVPGFHGKQCELEYNECLSTPCKNGGTCVDKIDKFSCVCSHGYGGIMCENKVDLCIPNPCRLNGTCTDEGNTFHCKCPPGLTGRICEYRVNECHSNPCQNQGTCIDLDNRFECKCPLTFAGVHCEYMLDVFAPPLEGADLTGSKHVHNLYIVAGTLSGAVLIGMVVLFACYCKMHETYKQVIWKRGGYKKRSLSCPDLEAYGEIPPSNMSKPRLSVGAIWEATSLCHDNAAYDHQLHQPLNTERI